MWSDEVQVLQVGCLNVDIGQVGLEMGLTDGV